jgi:hypothetical protein
MKMFLIATIIAVFMLTACAVPGRRGHKADGKVVIVPFLPSIVVLDTEPYYFHNDYHYRYDKGRWFYSKSRKGPWTDLPKNRYPKEVRFKGKNKQKDKDLDRDNRGRDDQHR